MFARLLLWMGVSKPEKSSLPAKAKNVLFQLEAVGPGLSVNSDQRWRSDMVFHTEEQAREYEAEFKKKCTTLRCGRYDAIRHDSCDIRIIMLSIG